MARDTEQQTPPQGFSYGLESPSELQQSITDAREPFGQGPMDEKLVWPTAPHPWHTKRAMSGLPAEDPDLEAAYTYDTVVVPRYARYFGELLLQSVRLPTRANVLDLACRTGYPSTDLLHSLGEGRIVAIDPVPAFLALARQRAGSEVGRRYFLRQEHVEALSFGDAVFTNVVGNLIDRATTDRGALLREAARVLRPHGQISLTMPLQGSFAEVLDMFREVALKHDLAGVAERIEQYALSMPSPENWRQEVESRGFERALVQEQTFTLEYPSGADLLIDPAIHWAALPEWQWCAAAVDDPLSVLYQVQDTIDTYFRGRTFETTVVAGCITAWRRR